MAYYQKKDRRIITELPIGAKTVGTYSKEKGCHYTNIYKMENAGKVEIVKYSGGGLFVIELQ